jgi:hypothetical protein
MGALDVLVIPIHFAAAIPTTPSYYVNVISKGPCTKLPLIIPFTSAERRRHWIMLRPVINIAMKRRVSRDMVVLVMHVLKIFFVDGVIHNIPPCIWIMVLAGGTFPTSPRASHVRILSRSALVVIIPYSIMITRMHLRASRGFYY